MKLVLSVVSFLISFQVLYAQTSYTWNGSTSGSWGNAANWTPAGVPGGLDDVTIVAAPNDCKLNTTAFINNITVTSGTLDLNGNLLIVSGPNALFTSGLVRNGGLFVNNANILTFGNGVFTLDCPGNFSAASISIRNSTFLQSVSITKTGATDDGNNRNNTFNAPVTIANAGSGYLLLGNGGADVFNSSANFDNLGSANLFIAYSGTNHRFNGTVTVSNYASNNSSILLSSLASGTVFNGDIVVNNSSADGNITICNSSTSASATQTAGHTLQIGGDGFSTGRLLIRRFTQLGNAPVNLNLTGTAEMNFGTGTAIGGALTVSAPNIYLSGSTFNGPVNLTKTDGNQTNASSGGNIFQDELSVNYISTSGTGYWSFGNGSPDVYHGDVHSNNNSLNRIIFGHASANNLFNGNFYVSQSGASVGTALTWNNGSSAIMAPGKTIFIGSDGLSSGYLYIQGLTQQGNTPVILTGTGTSSIYFGYGSAPNLTSIGGSVAVTAPDVYIRGTTFLEDVVITKTGGVSNHNEGRLNIFNGTVTINQQSSTGYFMLGYASNDEFNDDIILNAVGSGGINLGWTNGGGQPTLAAGKTIKIGPDGFKAGYLRLGGFVQYGNAPISLPLTDDAAFYIDNAGAPCTFGGDLEVTAVNIYIRGGIFNQRANFTKTGGTNNHNEGRQNIFNGVLTINQQSNSGYFMLGYNADDQFNEDIIVTASGSGNINFGWPGGSGKPGLAAGKTIKIGSSGFNEGALNLYSFTQHGSAPVNLTLGGTNATLRFSHNSVIGGDLNANTPNIYLNSSTFHGTVDVIKTGGTDNASQGGNIFHQPCTFTNNSPAYLLFGNNLPDTWNDDVTFSNTGSSRILPAWTSAGNEFHGNIILNATGSSTGIQFCGGNNSASAILSAGKTILSGSLGINSGNVILRQFTQLGNEPVNLLMGSSATYLQFGPSSHFGGDITSASPGLFFNGCIFDGTVNATKTGGNNDASAGNNIFNKNTVLTNAGSGYLLLGNGNSDEFNDNVTFNNLGTHHIYVAYNSSNNTFNGPTFFYNAPVGNTAIFVSHLSSGTIFNENIRVSSTNGLGVQFCAGNSTASASLSTGKTISVGTAGFTAGTLLLKQFTQSGSTLQNLNLTGASILRYGPSSYFGGDITSTSAGLFFDGCNFEGIVNATKTGTTNDFSAGNNIFHKNLTFTNNGTGIARMASSASDGYQKDVTFIKNSTGIIQPNYQYSCTYAGDITVSSSTPVSFGDGAGTAVLNGSSAQHIKVSPGTPAITFSRAVVNNTGGGVSLHTPVNVSVSLQLVSGLVHTSDTDILTMKNNSTVDAGTALSTSYIDGPMQYQKSTSGSSSLNFPIGNGSDCRPVILTVNHTNNALYTYRAKLYNASAAALGYTLPPAVDKVSSVHYYTIQRKDNSGTEQPVAGLSGNQTIQIFYGDNDITEDGYAATIVKNTYNNLTAWSDIGGNPTTVTMNVSGDITSTSSPTAFNSFSTFALGFRKMIILPVELIDFNAENKQDCINLNWVSGPTKPGSIFQIERSRDGEHFEAILTVNGKPASSPDPSSQYYTAKDEHPNSGNNYYRLKYTDTDGKTTYSKIIRATILVKSNISVYPNPASNFIYITGLTTSIIHTEWYDITGRLILAQKIPVQNGTTRMDLSPTLVSGSYLLRYRLENGLWEAKRIIIIR